ncbi:MAG: phosphoribosylglycinamide formyltransferase [Candidatus Omnitrophica bacterium]|nr:phosphoribosylglycinamide formyltransferase [Candidatus Omnitrophota bacterium]
MSRKHVKRTTHDARRTTNIAVLASGNGSNFEAIVGAIKRGYIKKTCVKLLITDKEKAYVRVRAERLGITQLYINPREYNTGGAFDKKLIQVLKKEKIGLVVLAGYMRILTPVFVKKFKNKVINIHPALLPAFKGARAIGDAYRYGVKITGVTVHFVDECIDHGPIIAQKPLPVKKGESLSGLERRIHRAEHTLYPLVIKKISEGKVKVRNRHVQVG